MSSVKTENLGWLMKHWLPTKTLLHEVSLHIQVQRKIFNWMPSNSHLTKHSARQRTQRVLN
jgi:hypothetical protein